MEIALVQDLPHCNASCVSCANIGAQSAALQSEIEILRAEYFKLTKGVDKVLHTLLNENL